MKPKRFKTIINAFTRQVMVLERMKQKDVYVTEIEFESVYDQWNGFEYKGKIYDINLDYYDGRIMVAIYEVDKEQLKYGMSPDRPQKVQLKLVLTDADYIKHKEIKTH